MSKNDGGSAFPRVGYEGVGGSPGMTLRDWFAGQALPAIIAGQIRRAKPGSISEQTGQLAYAIARGHARGARGPRTNLTYRAEEA